MEDSKVDIYRFNDKGATQSVVTIGYTLTAIILPDGETVIACAN